MAKDKEEKMVEKPEPEPKPKPAVKTPKKSDEPFKRLVCAGGQKWYVDADGNKLED